MTRWVDNHCHLDPESAADSVVEARAAGVDRIVNVGTDVDSSRRAIALARRLEGVWATAGVHPHESRHGIDGLESLLSESEVVAVGECGLDHHYDHSPRAVQREVFAAQVALAARLDRALVIHTREAWDETFSVLSAADRPHRMVFHCFTGGPAEARRALDLGADLSFSGIVTFKNAGEIRDAATFCPLDRLLVETDAPYLAPMPHRGQPNRPAWVPLVGAAIAEIKGALPPEVAAATAANAERIYGIGM